MLFQIHSTCGTKKQSDQWRSMAPSKFLWKEFLTCSKSWLSRIVKWAYQDNFGPLYLFFTKRFWAYQDHQRFPPSQKFLCTQKTVAFVVFCLLIFVFVSSFWLICVFVRSKSFRKKENWLKIVLIASFYYTTATPTNKIRHSAP